MCVCENGFWHVRLDEQSSRFTTFGTPFGRFKWKRLPFGISPAPELLQSRLDEVLTGLTGVDTIADDILVHGCGKEVQEAEADHDKNFLLLYGISQAV